MGFLEAPVITLMNRVLHAAIDKCRQEKVTDILGKSSVSSSKTDQK